MTAPPAAHPYCPHDEGEACDCPATLTSTVRRSVTYRPRTTARAAAAARLAAQGVQPDQIAAQLEVSLRTVQRLRRRTT